MLPAPLRKSATPRPASGEITAPPGCVVVSYDIHLDVPGPFGSSLSADRGFFNWAMVLMYSPALRSEPVSLRLLDVPATWGLRDLHVLGGAEPGKVEPGGRSGPQLRRTGGQPGRDWERFASPQFQQDGATYHVVVDGNPADYDMAKLDEVLGRITHAAVDWMQDRPYEEYTFLYHFPHGPGGGGMEHAYGTAIEVNAERLRESLAAAGERQRARVLPPVEREAYPAAVAGANRLPA